MAHSLCFDRWRILILNSCFWCTNNVICTSPDDLFKTSIGRVDPCAVSDSCHPSTPMEIAYGQRKEVLAILEEFTEIPVSAKLEQLSRLMYPEESKEAKEEFQKLLSTLPIESVREFFYLYGKPSRKKITFLWTFPYLP